MILCADCVINVVIAAQSKKNTMSFQLRLAELKRLVKRRSLLYVCVTYLLLFMMHVDMA